jgi:hypothetical protein
MNHLKRMLAYYRPGKDRLPDFMCIGAQRAGTTQLHQMLQGHSDIFLPPCKELHALDTMAGMDPDRWAGFRQDFLASVRKRSWRAGPAAKRKLAWAQRFASSETMDMEWYASLFREAGADQRAGDFTPSYALLPDEWVAAAVRSMPDLQVFFLMRDPVERAMSGAVHACTTVAGTHWQPSMGQLLTALNDPGCIARSRYRSTIERWESHLPIGNFHAIFFDDLVDRPDQILTTICNALGIRPAKLSRRRLGIANANPVRVDWPPDAVRNLARHVVDDCSWLAERFGGPATDWEDRAIRLSA